MENNFVKLTDSQINHLAQILEEPGFVPYEGDGFVSYWTKAGNQFYSMTEKCWNHISKGGSPDQIGTFSDEEGTIRYGLVGMATVKLKVNWIKK